MAEENVNTMNLDLNLGPADNSSDVGELPLGSYPNGAMNLQDWLEGPLETVRQRNHRWRSLWRQLPLPPEARSIALEFLDGNAPQTGEGSVNVASEERPIEVDKICDNPTGSVEDEDTGKNKDGGKSTDDEGSFFDCNICFDLSKDPVVTCCGHLFCWSCLYRWLHIDSYARECPVCKGEVTTKNVTPIYGRGNVVRDPDLDSSLKIPIRPHARSTESLREQRNATIPLEEMIMDLGSSYDLNQELAQIQPRHPNGARNSPERSSALLNRFLTFRGVRRERIHALQSDIVADLTDNIPPNYEMRVRHSPPRLSSLLLRRSSSHRDALLSNIVSTINSLESLDESVFHSNPAERNLELPQRGVVDDRNSMSSIAAAIHSESQTLDNAIEIDSTVAADVDSGDSRAHRRRLN